MSAAKRSSCPSDDVAALHDARPHLLGVAFRLLGTTADAEDAVQETYLRWYRLQRAERASIRNVEAWLTRVTSRVCLDVLRSARVRRESYVGPWLPEPTPALVDRGFEDDPLHAAVRKDTVGTALLIVMEAMTPAERVAFVLHDVFGYDFREIGAIVDRSAAAARQLAWSGRRRIETERARTAAPAEHDLVVAAFATACEAGDLAALTAILDPAVTLTSDGGGKARAALNVIDGADKVARFVLGVLERQRGVRLRAIRTGDGAALAMSRDTAVTGVINLRTFPSGAADVWIQWNPDKLHTWNSERSDIS